MPCRIVFLSLSSVSICMKQKYVKFAKNMALATGAAVAGGVLGAEAADLFTDSKPVIAASSTAAQYIASFAVFLPLHARDNPDLYRDENNRFKWRTYAGDMLKLNASWVVLDCLYIAGRPVLNYHLQRHGYDPATSSLLSDAISIPAYWALAIPIARGLKIIREEKTI